MREAAGHSLAESWRRIARAAALPVIFLLTILVLWELLVRVLGIPQYLLPSPVAILRSFLSDPSALIGHTAVTMFEAITGFCVANILGFALAILFAHSPTAARTVYPYAIALKTTPIVAMAPLLVLWFGTGVTSKIIASAVICFFPMLVNATRGLNAIEGEALDLFRSLDAGRLAILVKLRLPSSLPYLFSAFKISSSLSVVGAIVGEFVGAQRGLGYVILVSSYHLETERMFAAIIAAALGGVFFYFTVVAIEWLVVPWSDAQQIA